MEFGEQPLFATRAERLVVLLGDVWFQAQLNAARKREG
jgi:hypothetical protein